MLQLPRSPRTGNIGDRDQTEAQRRIANALRIGKVVAADYGRARYRVQIGDLVTGWVPQLALRAGPDRKWWPVEIGEQVLLASPGGDLNQGVILGSLYQSAFPAPGDRETLDRTIYADGTIVEYDRAAHRLTIDVKGDVRIIVKGTADVAADGAVTVKGSTIDLNP